MRLYGATNALVQHFEKTTDELAAVVVTFWDEVSRYFPEWQQVRERKITAGDVRRDFIHSHGIALQALGRVGNVLLRERPSNWKPVLKQLRQIDWSDPNARLWEGRASDRRKSLKGRSQRSVDHECCQDCVGFPLGPEEARMTETLRLAHPRQKKGRQR